MLRRVPVQAVQAAGSSTRSTAWMTPLLVNTSVAVIWLVRMRWSLERLLAQEMPLLPRRNSALRAVLMSDPGYIDGLVRVSDQIGQWITQAQAEGSIDPALPPLVVLYTLYARACDPVVGFLRESGQYSDADIVELVLRTCFDGLGAR